jgi:uncharacterized HhH-GPD family protein
MPSSRLRLPLSGDAEADTLLESDPLALLIGMVLDQQIPLEWAFKGPLLLRERLGGSLDVAEIAGMDPDALAAAFAGPPALHRYWGSMSKRVQQLCQHLLDEHAGSAADVWEGASDGAALLRRVKALPGFGDQKARIFVALLAKRLGFEVPGWQEAAGPYGEAGSYRSVADIDSPEALTRVRAYKKEMKAAAKAASES